MRFLMTSTKLYLPGISDGEYKRCRDAFECGKDLLESGNVNGRTLSTLVQVFENNPVGSQIIAAEYGSAYTSFYNQLITKVGPKIITSAESAVQWDKGPRSYSVLNKISGYGPALDAFRRQADKNSLHRTDAKGRAIPPTIEDVVRARTEAFHSGNKSLFYIPIWTSSHGVYESGGDRIKISKISPQLMDLPVNFTRADLNCDFSDAAGEIFYINEPGLFGIHNKAEDFVNSKVSEYLIKDKNLRKGYAEIVLDALKFSSLWWNTSSSCVANRIDGLMIQTYGKHHVFEFVFQFNEEITFLRVDQR